MGGWPHDDTGEAPVTHETGERSSATAQDRLGARLLELIDVMARLRRECPWDARQTHESLAPHLLEESYEALEALESGVPEALCEELGDVLLQVYFHAEIASERTDGTGYNIDDVAGGIAAKLIRRHPHVFGDVSVSSADEVKQNWDAIKAAEREAKGGGPASALDGVPFGQPALALAAQLQRRAERAGVPADLAAAPDTSAVGAPGGTEPGGMEPGGMEPGRMEPGGIEPGGIGAELFALVARARAAGLDPEAELRAAARAYRERVVAWEQEHRAVDS
jgi:XTP/dITP diphosphohydrolase